MADAFYVPLEADPSRTGEETGERFRSTGHTAGPWHARDQHAGPPAALLARAVERCAPRPDTLVARVSVDLLGPVPVAEVSVGARVLRPGRAVELVEAELSGPDGRVVARMTAWRIATAPSGVEPAAGEPAPLPVPAPQPFSLEPGWLPGYLQAVDWRWAEGHF
ncbi:MAG: thioesterase family protein, partial [Mycobacterium leprae]